MLIKKVILLSVICRLFPRHLNNLIQRFVCILPRFLKKCSSQFNAGANIQYQFIERHAICFEAENEYTEVGNVEGLLPLKQATRVRLLPQTCNLNLLFD